MARQDVKILKYSPVVKIPESEGLLVWHCSARLREYGLTLWVVSIFLCSLSHATWQPTRSTWEPADISKSESIIFIQPGI